LLLLPLLLCGLAGLSAHASQPPVFEISWHGQPRGYLVGTMHSDDPRILAVLPDLEALLERVDTLAVELIPDGLASAALLVATRLPGDRALEDLLGVERFAALASLAADRGLPPGVLDRLKPWAAAVTVGVPQPVGVPVLDTALYLAARDSGLRVVGLETVVEQLAAFDQLSPELQLALVDAVIKDASVLPLQVRALVDAYLAGDVQRLADVARTEYDGVDPRLQAWFDRELLERRNQRMLERSQDLLQRASTLIAVGALHLAGPSGLIEGLQGLGYDVEPLRGR
jgi:uncharacterized protein YbaP (TraB family)